LGQLPRSLNFPTSQFLRPNKGAGSLVGFQQATKFQLSIRTSNRVRVDRQVDRELAYCRELITDTERSRSDGTPHLVDELAVDRNPTLEVKPEAKGWLARTRHVINVLVN
jgi:hypothetical protein